jgi:hypothetical protein
MAPKQKKGLVSVEIGLLKNFKKGPLKKNGRIYRSPACHIPA